MQEPLNPSNTQTKSPSQNPDARVHAARGLRFNEGPIDDVKITRLAKYNDHRGWLMETFRHDDLEAEYFPTMGYTSLTNPGLSRGPHEHVDQADLFVFLGPGTFRMYLWDNRPHSATYLNQITFEAGEGNQVQVLVPKGVVHAYKNIGDTAALVHNFPNQLYRGPKKREPIDEIRHEDDPDSPFKVD